VGGGKKENFTSAKDELGTARSGTRRLVGTIGPIILRNEERKVFKKKEGRKPSFRHSDRLGKRERLEKKRLESSKPKRRAHQRGKVSGIGLARAKKDRDWGKMDGHESNQTGRGP